MASGQGCVEHYYMQRVCECAWQRPCATANPGFRPQIIDTVSLKYIYYRSTIYSIEVLNLKPGVSRGGPHYYFSRHYQTEVKKYNRDT
jgi:hypothetical protein